MIILNNGVAVVSEEDCLSKEVMSRGLESDTSLFPHLERLIKPGDWVVDVGAALGDHTAFYLRLVGKDGVVFAFEPHPLFFECLEHNCPRAERHNLALWHEPADLALKGAPHNEGTAHITKGGEYPVKAATLDSFDLPQLNYMKLDVEGSELFVLRGAEGTIMRHRPVMCLEINNFATALHGITVDDIYDWLENHGYGWESVRNNPGPRGRFCDIVARPK